MTTFNLISFNLLKSILQQGWLFLKFYNETGSRVYEQRKNKEKIIQIKPFECKWYQFLIIYGIINIYFFTTIHTNINYIYETFSMMYLTDLYVNGSDFSLLANLVAVPFSGVLAMISMGFLVLQELVVVLLFKYVYLKSIVEDEEMIRLCQYINKALIYFLLANVVGTIFWWDMKRFLLFLFLYAPVPVLTSKLSYSKLKRLV